MKKVIFKMSFVNLTKKQLKILNKIGVEPTYIGCTTNLERYKSITFSRLEKYEKTFIENIRNKEFEIDRKNSLYWKISFLFYILGLNQERVEKVDEKNRIRIKVIDNLEFEELYLFDESFPGHETLIKELFMLPEIIKGNINGSFTEESNFIKSSMNEIHLNKFAKMNFIFNNQENQVMIENENSMTTLKLMKWLTNDENKEKLLNNKKEIKSIINIIVKNYFMQIKSNYSKKQLKKNKKLFFRNWENPKDFAKYIEKIIEKYR